jgi:hypothetical protein
LFGVLIVTLCPAGSTQPVAESGDVALGAAATQIVSAIRFTNVTKRWSAAPEGVGEGAAEFLGEPVGAEVPAEAAAAAAPDWPATPDARAADGMVAVVAEAAALGDRLALEALALAALLALPAVAAAVAVAALVPAALDEPPPRLAQPAVTMTAASPATAASRYRRLVMPRLLPPK